MLELGSLASRLDFPAGTHLTRLSGDSGFSVSGSSVLGMLSNVIGPDGTNDSNGTIKLSGTFTSISFTATQLYTGPEDGILVQLVVAAPVFTDWRAIATDTAKGSVLGTSVTLSGTHVFGTPTSVLDGSWPYFGGPDYTPALPESDMIQIGVTPGAQSDVPPVVSLDRGRDPCSCGDSGLLVAIICTHYYCLAWCCIVRLWAVPRGRVARCM